LPPPRPPTFSSPLIEAEELNAAEVSKMAGRLSDPGAVGLEAPGAPTGARSGVAAAGEAVDRTAAVEADRPLATDDSNDGDDGDDEAATLRPPDSTAPDSTAPDSAAPDSGDEALSAGEPAAARAQDEDAEDPYLGTTIGERYVIDACIGEGGMGRVYLAHHKVIGKKMALKILHATLAKDKEAVSRFVREARSASSIGNAHIIDISDFGETADGSTYFAMEYLDGVTLAELIDERGALPAEIVCDIALQLCDGLAAAHGKNIVHRDLKPENVTLIQQGGSDRFCKILDFGIAKCSTSQSSTKLTMAGAVFGTPHYMSPEQAAGATVDLRTDLYALGVILYEMVAGRLPFNADNFMGILTQHMYKAPVPIRALVDAPDCHPGLEAIILKCLSKKPDARYQSMDELATDIRKFTSGQVPDAVHDMMARSGSFNVPADYFKTASTAVLPTLPTGPRRRLGPRYVAIAGVAAAVLIVTVVIMRDSTTTADTSPPSPATASAHATAPPRGTAAPSATSQVKVEVLLYALPLDAVAVVGGESVALPETFAVSETEPLEVEIRAAGYESQRLKLDGKQARVEVKLDKVADGARRPGGLPHRRHPRPHSTRRPGPKPRPGDVVDPWSH